MKKFFKSKKPRGFNMFSAIVAIILVMTGVVLTNTLISTEEKTSRQIYSMLDNYQLSDAANLSRADALQSFNYNFREKIENYLTFDTYKLQNEPGFELFRIDSTSPDFDFNSMKNNFEKVILLTDQNAGQQFDAAISYVADRTVDQFQGGTYGRFSVYLSDKTSNAKAAIYAATKSAIVAQGQNFLEVVKCDDTSCPDGSFYFNIPLNLINDDQYEALPRIIVKDLVTQEEIKMAILPRTNIKVYIPLRFFKALEEAKKTEEAIKAAEPELLQYKLGFCEPNSCAPRTNPKTFAGSSSWNNACPVAEAGSDVTFENITGLNVPGLTTYLTGGRIPGQNALKAFGAQEVCNKAINTVDAFGMNAFQTSDGDPNFGVPNTVLVPGDGRLNAIDGCGLNKLTVVINPEATHQTNLGTGEKLYCSKVTAVYADVVFEETNPSYIVKGTADPGKTDYYKIRISDLTYPQADASTFTSTTFLTCNSDAGAKTCTP